MQRMVLPKGAVVHSEGESMKGVSVRLNEKGEMEQVNVDAEGNQARSAGGSAGGSAGRSAGGSEGGSAGGSEGGSGSSGEEESGVEEVRRIHFIQCSEICTLRNEKFHTET